MNPQLASYCNPDAVSVTSSRLTSHSEPTHTYLQFHGTSNAEGLASDSPANATLETRLADGRPEILKKLLILRLSSAQHLEQVSVAQPLEPE